MIILSYEEPDDFEEVERVAPPPKAKAMAPLVTEKKKGSADSVLTMAAMFKWVPAPGPVPRPGPTPPARTTSARHNARSPRA